MAKLDRSKGLKMLVVDDHPIIVNALISSLTSLDTFGQIDHAKSLAEALSLLAEDGSYEIVILDLNLGDSTGTDSMIVVRGKHPDMPLVIFSADESPDTISAAFEHGVHGYIPKRTPLATIIDAIKGIVAGTPYVPPQAIEMLGFRTPALRDTRQEAAPGVKMSPRQKQVFEYLLQGMPNKVIADRLGMAEGTVKTHLNTIYRMLSVHNRVQAILRARELGLG